MPTREVAFYAAISLPQPWKCFFCDEKTVALTCSGPIDGKLRCVLHHIDGNHENNDPSNWAWAHNGCHVRHHAKLRKGEKRSAAAIQSMRDSRRGRPVKESTKEAISISMKRAYAEGRRVVNPNFNSRGRVTSEETKRKISESLKARSKSSNGGASR